MTAKKNPAKPAKPAISVVEDAPDVEAETVRTEIPSGAAMPQDRKPKKGKKDGKLHVDFAGGHWTIDGEVLDDIEFMEAAEANLYAYCGQQLLGKQWNKFKEAIRDEKTGRARVTRVIEFMNAAAEQANAKNS